MFTTHEAGNVPEEFEFYIAASHSHTVAGAGDNGCPGMGTRATTKIV